LRGLPEAGKVEGRIVARSEVCIKALGEQLSHDQVLAGVAFVRAHAAASPVGVSA
jgi:hypothetical protein